MTTGKKMVRWLLVAAVGLLVCIVAMLVGLGGANLVAVYGYVIGLLVLVVSLSGCAFIGIRAAWRWSRT